MITLEEFTELKDGIKQLNQLRKQWKELKARSVIGASSMSYGRAQGGYSDRVFARVAALDEIEHTIYDQQCALYTLLYKVYNPIYDCFNYDLLPNTIRVYSILEGRCLGKSWEEIGKAWEIKGSTCRDLIRRYEKQLKKRYEEEYWD